MLCDFRDGSDRRLTCALCDTLLNGNSGSNAAEIVDIGARHLFNKLAGISRHRLHETTLSFSKNNIKCQRGFARARYASDDADLIVWNHTGDIFQVMLTRTAHDEGILIGTL